MHTLCKPEIALIIKPQLVVTSLTHDLQSSLS